jgi:hypothetical protein
LHSLRRAALPPLRDVQTERRVAKFAEAVMFSRLRESRQAHCCCPPFRRFVKRRRSRLACIARSGCTQIIHTQKVPA